VSEKVTCTGVYDNGRLIGCNVWASGRDEAVHVDRSEMLQLSEELNGLIYDNDVELDK